MVRWQYRLPLHSREQITSLLRRWHFSVKMKTKELGPVGGRALENFAYRSADDFVLQGRIQEVVIALYK